MQHNKKRNTALVYEFLIRYITKCLYEDKKANADRAMLLIQRFFSSGPMREELNLFTRLINQQVSDPHHAQKLLNAVLEQAKTLDHKKLEHQKSRLIKEINSSLDADAVYKSKVPWYSIYASVQTLINHNNGKQKTLDAVDRVQLEQKVIGFLAQKRSQTQALDEALKLDPRYNNIVYKFVIKRLDEKYKDALTESQKKLLTKYALYLMSENKKVFEHAFAKEIEKIQHSLAYVRNKEILQDKQLMERIKECHKQAMHLSAQALNETTLVKTLKLMNLAEEVSQ